MIDYREILRLKSCGISQRSIAVSCNSSRNTVAEVLRRAEQVGISWNKIDSQTNSDLQNLLFPEQQAKMKMRRLPDCEYMHREMAKSGMTLTLLWNEYCEGCRQNGELPLMYTQFCNHYRKYAQLTKATMHIERKPGEQMEVDWAGSTARLVDRDTGETEEAYVYVAVLSNSLYAYVEAFPSQHLECWINAHVNAFVFFGGVTRILVPDNLKTGVSKPSWYNPVINKTYHEMAEHYDVAVIPARVGRPKDKPNAESTVGAISTWILASLRRSTFFSIHELNEAIWERLDEFNRKPFQKKPGSRLDAFLEERPFLKPLPELPYELATWKVATVQFNYHINLDKMFYSVPYEYIRQQVDVRVTKNVIEVFFHNNRICSHPRLKGAPGQYSTVIEHMPDEHRQYTQWNAERFTEWAAKVGKSTQTVIVSALRSHKVEQQGYRACMAILKLADRYSLQRLESACAKALSYTPSPGYRNISAILKSGQDRLSEVSVPKKDKRTDEHGFTRGAEYYGRASK
jgi:transposase